jgi:hypothetical protein
LRIRKSFRFLKKRLDTATPQTQNTQAPASMVDDYLVLSPKCLAFDWLNREMERIDREERVFRFGTVYVKYGKIPNMPEAKKPDRNTYLTQARRLIPRRRSQAPLSTPP